MIIRLPLNQVILSHEVIDSAFTVGENETGQNQDHIFVKSYQEINFSREKSKTVRKNGKKEKKNRKKKRKIEKENRKIKSSNQKMAKIASFSEVENIVKC